MTLPWLPTQQRDYAITNVRAVLPHRVLPQASLLVREGRIAEIRQGNIPRVYSDMPTLDAQQLLLIPGIIDLHADGLETAALPRPGARMPLDFAFAEFESRMIAAGITTAFHGIGLSPVTTSGSARSMDDALALHGLVTRNERSRIHHRALYRVGLRYRESAEALLPLLAAHPSQPTALVSLEDHSPGQGQYKDSTVLAEYIAQSERVDLPTARRRVLGLAQQTRHSETVKDESFTRMYQLASTGRVRLLIHDPGEPEAVDDFADRGGHVAEFPTTLAAAQRAQQRGMPVIAGAPNLVRGASHSGNVSVQELMTQGLVDILVSDYLPTSLLAAVGVLVRGGQSWSRAIACITSSPAEVAGLTDRGALTEGLRADLTLVDDRSGPWPTAVWSSSAGK